MISLCNKQGVNENTTENEMTLIDIDCDLTYRPIEKKVNIPGLNNITTAGNSTMVNCVELKGNQSCTEPCVATENGIGKPELNKSVEYNAHILHQTVDKEVNLKLIQPNHLIQKSTPNNTDDFTKEVEEVTEVSSATCFEDQQNSTNDVDELERLATEELLAEAKRGAERAREVGVYGWERSRIPTANKRFLVSTIRQAMRGKDGRYNASHNLHQRPGRSPAQARTNEGSRNFGRHHREPGFSPGSNQRRRRIDITADRNYKKRERSSTKIRSRSPVLKQEHFVCDKDRIRKTTPYPVKSSWSSDDDDDEIKKSSHDCASRTKCSENDAVRNFAQQESMKDRHASASLTFTSSKLTQYRKQQGQNFGSDAINRTSTTAVLKRGIKDMMPVAKEHFSEADSDQNDLPSISFVSKRAKYLKRTFSESQNSKLAIKPNDCVIYRPMDEITRAKLDIVDEALREIHESKCGVEEVEENKVKSHETATASRDRKRKTHKKHKKHKHKTKRSIKSERSRERGESHSSKNSSQSFERNKSGR